MYSDRFHETLKQSKRTIPISEIALWRGVNFPRKSPEWSRRNLRSETFEQRNVARRIEKSREIREREREKERNAYKAARRMVEWWKGVVVTVETEKGTAWERERERGRARAHERGTDRDREIEREREREREREERQSGDTGAKAVRVVRPAGQSCCGGNPRRVVVSRSPVMLPNSIPLGHPFDTSSTDTRDGWADERREKDRGWQSVSKRQEATMRTDRSDLVRLSSSVPVSKPISWHNPSS